MAHSLIDRFVCVFVCARSSRLQIFGPMAASMRGQHLVILVLLMAVTMFSCPVAEAQVGKKPPATFTLGDSLVDVGNNNYLTFTLATANHKPYGLDRADKVATGRFSNGKIIPDFISKSVSVTHESRILHLRR